MRKVQPLLFALADKLVAKEGLDLHDWAEGQARLGRRLPPLEGPAEACPGEPPLPLRLLTGEPSPWRRFRDSLPFYTAVVLVFGLPAIATSLIRAMIR